MDTIPAGKYLAEEQIVAELAHLGLGYLSRASDQEPTPGVRPPAQLLADLVRQPSSRVRTAIIPLLLEHPEYAAFVPQAIARLHGSRQRLLEVFYTAAVFLQRKHEARLSKIQGEAFLGLLDLFSQKFGIPSDLSPDESLDKLAQRHQELTGIVANWSGTYENAVQHWLRLREKESA